MALVVKKFGGSSLSSTKLFERAAGKVIDARDAGEDVVVVLSAMGDETDRLLLLAKAITDNPSPREMDVLLTAGERVSMALFSISLVERGCAARSYTGSQVPIITDSNHRRARIEEIGTERLLEDISQGIVPVVAGFQGVDRHRNITTLGRGGSDTTAVALAVALKADECQIFTDVEGVYTTDPRIVPQARKLDRITFEEMLELSSSGSKVVQIRAVKFAARHKLPLRVLSSFDVGDGTLITDEETQVEAPEISGIAYNKNEAEIVILGLKDHPSAAAQVFKPLSDADIQIDMIVQNPASDGGVDLGFTVGRDDFHAASDIATKVVGEGATVVGNERVAKITVVGMGIRSHPGTASLVFEALAGEGISVRMISTSEIKISVLVDEKYLELGVRTLHEAFGLDVKKA
ncbi:MAG: aspartate kinase [Gammaproteobacteria bacterium]|nr:aspartate kinase [Gammaproteobacteria bacterium]